MLLLGLVEVGTYKMLKQSESTDVDEKTAAASEST
jgi:hypothetical protein